MGSKVTMSSIAQALGVSTVTVSRALAGKAGVGDDMRDSILRKAADMGYPPKLLEKTPLQGKSVGILISCRFIGRGHTFYWDMYERALECLGEYDAVGILEPVKLEEESRDELPRLIRGRRVQALLLIGQFAPRFQQALAASGLPVVQLDEYSADLRLDAVISDGYYGMYTMTRYLLRRGHRKIAYVGLVGATSSITDRYYGYCRALGEDDIPVRPDWVIPDRKEGEVFEIPIPEELPTAFVCNSDWVAQRLLRQLDERGVRVPEDVSIVGFDGFMPFQPTENITTYAVDMEGMVRAGVAHLMERIINPEQDGVLHIVPGRLREGNSVKTIEN